MLDCFNEGFTDEESFAATSSHIPKVYLNFANAHLDDLQPEKEMADRRQMSPEGGRMTAMTALDDDEEEE